jgi:ParB family chromosome partitioning protein
MVSALPARRAVKMMTSKTRRGGLGRGLGALIPTAAPPAPAPVLTSSPAAENPNAEVIRPPDLTSSAGIAPARVPADDVSELSPTSMGVASDAGDAGDGLGQVPVQGAIFAEIPVTAIVANTKQPRQVFDEDALSELTHSIREFGVLQPVVVRASPALPAGQYELVMGERRLRAATAAGLDVIPAIVRDTADDAMLRDALLENLHRAGLNPLEEAAAYQQLLEEFGATHEELAQRIGRSRSQVTNTIRLMNLPVAVQRRVAAGILSAGHARALLGLPNADQQDELAGRIVAEGLSVRATEELVALGLRDADSARPRRSAAKRITAPHLVDLAERLSDTLETRVRVDIGQRKGKITVEFGSIDDLERIVAAIAPDLNRPDGPGVD